MLDVENLPANAGGIRDLSSIPGLGKSPGGGKGSAFQYSCQRNPMDRGAWRATAHKVAKSWTWLTRLSMQALIIKTLTEIAQQILMIITYLKMYKS